MPFDEIVNLVRMATRINETTSPEFLLENQWLYPSSEAIDAHYRYVLKEKKIEDQRHIDVLLEARDGEIEEEWSEVRDELREILPPRLRQADIKSFP